jgi:oligopeptide transport system ATP-binding protein
MALLGDLRRDFGMATILITHDLGVVAGFCEEVMVMYGGQVMEKSPVDPLFADPAHPYTRGLLQAIPRVDQHGRDLATIPGAPPNMTRAPKGCPFAPRCTHAGDDCLEALAPLAEFAPGRYRACNRTLGELA